MKKVLFTFFVVIILSMSLQYETLAKDGDTTKVRTIEFTSRRGGWYDFNVEGKKYQRVLMNYKIKCPPGKPCGEWDYLAYVYVNRYYAPNYRLNKKSTDSAMYMLDTSWAYAAVYKDGQYIIEKTPKEKILLEYYNDPNNPTKRTDSMWVWPTYFNNYKVDDTGKMVDSSFVKPDRVIYLSKKQVFYNDDVTIAEPIEIMRYITPYGNGLKLGDGFNFVIDVTDFLPLLQGKVNIFAPCGGWGDQYSQDIMESLELTFDFIEGTPTREIVDFKLMWNTTHVWYNENIEKNFLVPKSITFKDNEKNARLKVIQTGHGFGATEDNCSEFCWKKGYVKVDNSQKYAADIWRRCSTNPIYPQGGTWVYDRSNWCPGSEVNPFDFELSDFINTNSTHLIDYDLDDYELKITNTNATPPNWVISSYLITYGDLNFNLDAAITDIIAPSKKDLFKRLNPICSTPVIEVKNNGKSEINSIKFEYGLKNKQKSNFTWTGSLKKLESNYIELPLFEVNETISTKFEVSILEVNGKADEYSANNSASSDYESVPYYPQDLTINLKTNTQAAKGDYKFYVLNAKGDTVISKYALNNNKAYNENMKLEEGCYYFHFINESGIGLDFWASRQYYGTGSLGISSKTNNIVTFAPDFGYDINHYFRVGPVTQAVLSKDTLQFDSLEVNEKQTLGFEIAPLNKLPITISSMAINLGTKNGFTIVSTEPAITYPHTIKEGEKLKINIEYQAVKAGAVATSLTINTNDFYEAQKRVRLVGYGKGGNSIDDNLVLNPSYINIQGKPESGSIRIEFSNGMNYSNQTSLKLYNSVGQEIDLLFDSNIDFSSQFIDFNTNMLNSGAYYLVLSSDNKTVTKPFVINR